MVSQNPRKPPVLPPTCFIAALAAAIIVHVFLPVADGVPYPWSLGGAIPLVVGIWFNLDADRAFKVHGTTVKPFQESTALVTDGAYGISRHPMYLGMILILLGLAILLGTLSPFVVVPVLWILLDRRFVRIEEQMMSHTFRTDWQRYIERVRRWV